MKIINIKGYNIKFVNLRGPTHKRTKISIKTLIFYGKFLQLKASYPRNVTTQLLQLCLLHDTHSEINKYNPLSFDQSTEQSLGTAKLLKKFT